MSECSLKRRTPSPFFFSTNNRSAYIEDLDFVGDQVLNILVEKIIDTTGVVVFAGLALIGCSLWSTKTAVPLVEFRTSYEQLIEPLMLSGSKRLLDLAYMYR
jgi:hypothetical protein